MRNQLYVFLDMWPFSETEHYTYNNRFVDGYSFNNVSENEFKFFDINRWRWCRKLEFLKNLFK